jgi:hypothetical protein
MGCPPGSINVHRDLLSCFGVIACGQFDGVIQLTLYEVSLYTFRIIRKAGRK